MADIEFGQLQADLPAYQNTGSIKINNVIPLPQGYKSFPRFVIIPCFDNCWTTTRGMTKVASIPLVVVQQLSKQGIMTNAGAIKDKVRFRKWLNDPDNRFFKTYNGTI